MPTKETESQLKSNALADYINTRRTSSSRNGLVMMN